VVDLFDAVFDGDAGHVRLQDVVGSSGPHTPAARPAQVLRGQRTDAPLPTAAYEAAATPMFVIFQRLIEISESRPAPSRIIVVAKAHVLSAYSELRGVAAPNTTTPPALRKGAAGVSWAASRPAVQRGESV